MFGSGYKTFPIHYAEYMYSQIHKGNDKYKVLIEVECIEFTCTASDIQLLQISQAHYVMMCNI